MRPVVLFSAICAGGLVLIGALLLSTSRIGETKRANVSAQTTLAVVHGHSPKPVKTASSQNNSQSETQSALEEIDSVMLQVDERTLPLLCAKLTAFEPEVGKAAVSNLVILADKQAIPALTEAVNRITDSEEKAAIHKAIEFLQLPTYDELVANGSMKPLGKISPSPNQTGAEAEPRPAAPSNPQ